MTIRTLMIDPGHGGLNPAGAVYVTPGKRYVYDDGTTIYEGVQMRRLAQHVAAQARRAGMTVIDSLTGGLIGSHWLPEWRDVPLSARVAHANAQHLDLFLSLHSDAISNSSSGPGQTRARGGSVYTSEGQTGSDPIATRIHASLVEAGVLPMRQQTYTDGDPDYEAGLYVLRRTRAPAVLIENGFHDHRADAEVLLDDDKLRALAAAIVAGMVG